MDCRTSAWTTEASAAGVVCSATIALTAGAHRRHDVARELVPHVKRALTRAERERRVSGILAPRVLAPQCDGHVPRQAPVVPSREPGRADDPAEAEALAHRSLDTHVEPVADELGTQLRGAHGAQR